MTIDLIERGEILRLAALAQDDYPRRIVDLEEYTEDWRQRTPDGEIFRFAALAQEHETRNAKLEIRGAAERSISG